MLGPSLSPLWTCSGCSLVLSFSCLMASVRSKCKGRRIGAIWHHHFRSLGVDGGLYRVSTIPADTFIWNTALPSPLPAGPLDVWWHYVTP